MIDLKELRRLAEGATSGPWKASQLGLIGPGIDNFIAQELWLPDMDFIAAVNPAVVIELLDALEELIAQANSFAKGWYDYHVERVRLLEVLKAARVECETFNWTTPELRIRVEACADIEAIQ